MREEKRRVTMDTMKVSMVLSDRTIAKLQQVRGFIQRDLSNEELIDLMADRTIRSFEKGKFKLLG